MHTAIHAGTRWPLEAKSGHPACLWGQVSLFLLLVSDTAAQALRSAKSAHGGWGPLTRYDRLYHPGLVEKMCGMVLRIETIVPIRGMSDGRCVVVDTVRGLVSLHVGPAWFIDHQPMAILPGDWIEFAGSPAAFDGQPAVIAAYVKKGKGLLALRDEHGCPCWHTQK